MSTSNKTIKILGSDVKVSSDFWNIYDLNFLEDNPRVFSCVHGEDGFSDLSPEEKQDRIYEKLLEEQSVKNLIPEIKRHGGLMDNILIRHDRKQVIEGNSRLAVYRKLNDQEPDGDWELIPCDIIGKLTDEQQDAYLNQIHVKGKTAWSAYEKANFAYVRHERGMSSDRIAEIFGETVAEIEKRVKIIDMMRGNGDTERSHVSYYDVLVRNKEISKEIRTNNKLKDTLLKKIKNFGVQSDQEEIFTAQELRDKLPKVIAKRKILNKFVKEELCLDDCYQDAKESSVRSIIKRALQRIKDIGKKEVKKLEVKERNALEPELRRLKQEVLRVEGLVKEIKKDESF